ncbi:MAG: N-acyl homoserine lactonase family protein [Atopobiaceae bacterium]|jgi:glyoxylase-like metal-dependent hydrolase (beta-lactamase superfamily II)|nr:N-acyl homoserine lactonase family protein [Atopobiaceae bacterium]MCI2174140.1 N-acyl homoserine lactonase family protein [Atopobiaceae bacterium]MCI2206781.1 N-acyl homoserine lactonase family protein [Atopobiaceae bacterium]
MTSARDLSLGTVTVHALHCGSVGTDETIPDRSRSANPLAYTGVLRGERHRVWLPVYCYLIEAPAGRVLVDTSWHTDVREDQRKALSWELNVASKAVLPAGEAVSEQLARLGLAPSDLDMVFLTHLDVDHASGLKLVSSAPRICCSREELDAAGAGGVRYNPRLWEGVDLEPLDLAETGEGPEGRGLDVFGDGSVRIVELAGHSLGMCGVIAEAAGRFVLMTGDACYDRASWEDQRLPGICADRDAAASALAWVRDQAADPACIEVLATHDPEVVPHDIVLGGPAPSSTETGD